MELHRWIWAVAFLAAALPGSPTFPIVADAADNQTENDRLQKQVLQFVRELASESRAARTAARQHLLELGTRALAHLPPPELLPTPSIRDTVAAIRVELETQQARESVRTSMVSVSGTETLADWLAEFSRQTGNGFDLQPLPHENRTRMIRLNLKEVPFWPAVDELAARAAVTIESSNGERGLAVREPRATPTDVTVGYSGPFRLAVGPANLKGDVTTSAVSGRLVRTLVTITPEPRLRPLFLQYRSVDITAEGSAAKKFPSFNPEAQYEVPLSGEGGQARIQLDFVRPGADNSRTMAIRGKLRMTTAARQERIRFTDLWKEGGKKSLGTARRKGGVTVTLQRVIREPAGAGKQDLRFRTTVTYDSGGPAFESHRTWILHNEVYLEDRAGQRVALNGGFETTLQDDGAVGMEYRFVGQPAELPDYALVYVAPTLIIDVPIEFAIESVPLKELPSADK